MNRECRIEQVLQKSVDDGDLAGAAAAVWRDGAIEAACAGWRDIGARLPMERDTIFRIASMTKPITSVAALMLVEERQDRARRSHRPVRPGVFADAGAAVARRPAGRDR